MKAETTLAKRRYSSKVFITGYLSVSGIRAFLPVLSTGIPIAFSAAKTWLGLSGSTVSNSASKLVQGGRIFSTVYNFLVEGIN